jgi:hypothetical protein
MTFLLQDAAILAEREQAFEYARGGLLIALLFGAIVWDDYKRLDNALAQAAELAAATRH